MAGSIQARSCALRFSLALSLGLAAHGCSDEAEPSEPLAGASGASAVSQGPAGMVAAAGQTATADRAGVRDAGASDPGDAGAAAASAGRASPAAGGGGGTAGLAGSAMAMSAGSAASAGVSGSSAAAGSAGMADGAGAPGAAGQAGGGGATEPPDAGTPQPAQWRIQALGDSITETSCASQLLDHGLRAAGHTAFDLVGTRRNEQACGTPDADRDCEGHSGYLVTDLIGQGQHAAELTPWCESGRADVVLMHFGTNDVWSDIDPTRILDAFSGVLAALRAAAPNVMLFVAQIIPMRPEDCGECASRVEALNALVPDWAAMETTAASPVHVVDQWTGFDPAADTGDGVHPNLQGSQKMADHWLEALETHGVF